MGLGASRQVGIKAGWRPAKGQHVARLTGLVMQAVYKLMHPVAQVMKLHREFRSQATTSHLSQLNESQSWQHH